MEKIILCKEGKDLKPIIIDRITHITYEDYTSTIHFISNEQLKQAKLLKTFEKELYDKGFIRVNRNILVNISQISNINTLNRSILLKSNKKITISFRKLAEFRKILKN